MNAKLPFFGKSLTTLSFLIAVVFFLLQSSCYSFRGISIPPEVNTYKVANFDNKTLNALPTIAISITEKLKDKIRRETRLTYSETEPDIEFKGSVTQYRVTSEAPKPGELTAINRLTIAVQVEFINNKKEDSNWKSRFSFFNDFGTDQNLIDIQEDLIENIDEQIVEDIFNKAFTNW